MNSVMSIVASSTSSVSAACNEPEWCVGTYNPMTWSVSRLGSCRPPVLGGRAASEQGYDIQVGRSNPLQSTMPILGSANFDSHHPRLRSKFLFILTSIIFPVKQEMPNSLSSGLYKKPPFNCRCPQPSTAPHHADFESSHRFLCLLHRRHLRATLNTRVLPCLERLQGRWRALRQYR